MSTYPGPQSVRDNCSFALDPCRTLRLEVSEVRLSSWESQKNCRKLENTSYLLLHNSPCNRSCTSISCMSTYLGPQSVRDNCSFALGPCRTLRLEVSEVRLSSWESQKMKGYFRMLHICHYPTVHATVHPRQSMEMSTYPGPQSVRDNCSFALDPCRTLRLEVSEVRLSSWESQKHCRKRENTSYLPLHNSPCNRSCTSLSCKCQHILALNQSGITVLSHWTHAGPSD